MHGQQNIKIHNWYSNIYPTRRNVTQFILYGLLYVFRVVSSSIIRSANNCIYSIWCLSPATCRLAAGSRSQIPDAVDTVVRAPDVGWRYHPKHVEQISDKINCVTLHLFGYMFEYSYDARTHERQTLSTFEFWMVVFSFRTASLWNTMPHAKNRRKLCLRFDCI